MSKPKLFAVYLGGKAPRANTELHDVVFVTGSSIEDTYEPLMNRWFGSPKGLHLDSWIELDIVDGYRVELSATKPSDDVKLFFVNLGAYREGEFCEIHANKFLVAQDAVSAKARGKKELMQNWGSPVHTDDLYEVDDCLAVDRVEDVYVVLEKTDEVTAMRPCNGYHVIPKPIVADYLSRHPERR